MALTESIIEGLEVFFSTSKKDFSHFRIFYCLDLPDSGCNFCTSSCSIPLSTY